MRSRRLLIGGRKVPVQVRLETERIAAIVAGDEGDPFAVLGMHRDGGRILVRTFLPHATRVRVISDRDSKPLGELERLDGAGLFAGIVDTPTPCAYRLEVIYPDRRATIHDPYAFGSLLDETDRYLMAEGTHHRSFEKMGAHPCVLNGVSGTNFVVWAPNARRVSVIGDFNAWDGRRHPMRRHPGAGLWDIFLPGVEEGALYKFEIRTGSGGVLAKADPFAFSSEPAPRTASIVHALPQAEAGKAGVTSERRHPVSIYEVHLGSWRRAPEESNRSFSFDELAETLIPYASDMGFTHLELMPISEHPFEGSWGYQPVGLFAPTSRLGSPEAFARFVRRCHEAGLGVILDWAVAHFPDDPHGLVQFDGTHLYEHRDPREGRHPDWGTCIYNYGRREVQNYLLANALFWLGQYGIDGLRVDAVASMLYRNYSRKDGEWIANADGGVENTDAIAFIHRLNTLVYREHPGAVTIAEESTAWPMVSVPVDGGGLGFGYKWNMGWMHDTLAYMSEDPVNRKYHHGKLTFGLLYAFGENFILPLSHDEVVHGKGSLLAKMPGDAWQKFANLRAYLAFQFTHPGKKLLFMGGEFGQVREWNHDRGLDWHLLEDPRHVGIQRLVRDLNRLYKEVPALHERDCESGGFAWIDCDDAESSVISYLRKAFAGEECAIVVCNFTPVVRHGYRIGVPRKGSYLEVLNTDSTHYGGSNVGNLGRISADAIAAHGHKQSLSLTLPPLGVIVLRPGDRP